MDYSKLSTATLKALKAGQKLDYSTLPTEDLLVLRQMAKTSKPAGPSVIESGLRGAAQGASFGFADEITGGLEAAFTDKTYEQARDESRAAYEKAQEANPMAYLAGDVGGSLATSLVPGLGVAKGASTMARIGKAAALGGAAGLGYSDADTAAGLAGDTATGAALGGAFQGIGDKIVSPALDKVTDAKWLGRTLANVPEDVTEKYLKDPTKYADDVVKPLEVIKDEIDANSRRILGAREAAKESLGNVTDEYKTVLGDKVRELDNGYNAARSAVSEARGEFGRASRDLVNDLKSVKPGTEVVDKLTEAIELLSDQVSAGSAASFDALEREGVEVSRTRLVKLINDARKSLQIAENVPPMAGSPARKHYDQLTKTILDIRAKMPTSLKGGSVKRIIQDLDDTINYIETVGGRSARADAANSTIRGGLNQTLRNKSEAFAGTMDSVARKTDLLSKLNKGFGSKEQILNRIMELPSENAVYKRELLQKLADETGVKVDDLIKEYMQAQSLLRDPNSLQMAKEGLSEYQQMQKAKEALAGMPQTAYDRRLAATTDVEANTDLVQRMTGAQSDVLAAEEAYKNSFVSDAGSEPLIKRFLSGRKSIEDERLVQRIKPELADDIDALRVNTAFDKPDVAGSRRTLAGQAMGKLVGMGVGSAAGYEAGGEYGAGAGALAGFSLDRHAGKVFRQMLNGKVAADKVIAQLAPKLGKYAQPLMTAAQRSSRAFAATHFILAQRDPEYRKTIEGLDMDEAK
ncbi:hypothetical protein UFOVP1351_26 [uncultured Caudovirales phage]|uniref:Uncharacterized protein n=1 Tax=uncultured Caudovirales phage TaxID=2100421 RepID=A0A6J5S3Y6_9CAUD|nr:hypothetical protein UFOVP1351_26 [uncultured Caudovirales phage]